MVLGFDKGRNVNLSYEVLDMTVEVWTLGSRGRASRHAIVSLASRHTELSFTFMHCSTQNCSDTFKAEQRDINFFV